MGRDDADIEPFLPDESEMLGQHRADLWARAYGFEDAEDMKAEGKRMERKYRAQKARKQQR
ncbi:hypothetical protein [uncultured Tateyamaria sp.]|uniref:hypothetical protein n=1 Tax=uncultured Tateyamaria sp. TaxID=455651 RepID=UPI0026274600|nr:hypothetical protein [uncultured Tateyamaria sp.]